MKITAFLFSLFLSAGIQAHESYFSFAEMQYDSTCSCLEITLTLSAHDLEEFALREKTIPTTLEAGLDDEDLRNNLINDIILNGFNIRQFRKDVILYFEGYELFDDGTCSFYLRSDEIAKADIELFFGLFMNRHAAQQNKLTYIKQDTKTVYNFFIFKRENEIQL